MNNKENKENLQEDIDSTFDIAEDKTVNKDNITPQAFFVSEISKEFERFNNLIWKTKKFEIKKNIFTSSIDVILKNEEWKDDIKITIQYVKYIISSISVKTENRTKSIYYIPLTSVTYKEWNDIELKLLSKEEINTKMNKDFKKILDKAYTIAKDERKK